MIRAFFFCLLLIGSQSCKVNYSFTGASIPPDVKTVSVSYFPNYAPLAQPTLSQTFTEALRDILLRQTPLSLVEGGGDLHFEGEIRNYLTSPVAVQGNETAARNRLTITVKVRYVNTKDENQNFEQSFSRFADYDGGTALSEVEEDLIKEVNDQLVQDIFNRALSNW
ncbi:MAG: hypothetical protein COA57_02645 [Flavobacteriales bacterium]|nr:MAG: hypothetical protein COA57_02645 [Flavobacteriales bacterium]